MKMPAGGPAAAQGRRPTGWGEPLACGRLSSRSVAPAGNPCRQDCRQQARLPTPPARATTVSTYEVVFVFFVAGISGGGGLGQFWNDEEVFELESEGNDLTAENGQVVLVAAVGLLDQAVHPEAFEEARDLRAAEPG